MLYLILCVLFFARCCVFLPFLVLIMLLCVYISCAPHYLLSSVFCSSLNSHESCCEQIFVGSCIFNSRSAVFHIAQIVVWLARSALARLGVVRLVAVSMNLHKLHRKTFWIWFDVAICSLVFCLSLVLSRFLFACLFLFSLAFRVCSFICSRFVLGGFVFAPHWRCFLFALRTLRSRLPFLCFASPLLFLVWVFSRFVVVLVCRCWVLVCMFSLLYESPRRKPGWRLTAGSEWTE